MHDDLSGSIVADPTGRRYGRLDEIFTGRTSGRPEFGIVSLDEAGTERVAVPLDGARRDGDDVLLPLALERVVAAPRVQGDVEEIPADAARLIRAHFGLDEGTTAVMEPGPASEPPPPPPDAEDETEIVVSEEQLAVETRSVPTERVRVRKAVITEDVSITVTVRREELIVEREPIHSPPEDTAGELAIGERGDVEFVLHAEEPVVTKRVVPVERVRLRRNEIVEEERITDTVRKERVEVDQNPTTREHTP